MSKVAEEIKHDFTDEEEEVMKKLILDQDIEYYHDYMQSIKSKFNESEPKYQASMMAIYHAVECVWTHLLNLKKVVEIGETNE
jgi:hypothetical protein